MAMISAFIDKQLVLVDKLMLKDFKIKKSSIWDEVDFNKDTEERKLYPQLLLLSYFMFKKESNKKLLGAAAILQFIYIASEIHKYDGDNPQYPVLIGDYLYGKYFTYLCEYQMLEWLTPLADTVTLMQLGSIERLEQKYDLQKIDSYSIVEKERGRLGEVSSQMGASMANAPKEARRLLGEIGFLIGLITGLMKEEQYSSIKILRFIEEAEEKITALSVFSPQKERINQLYKILKDYRIKLLDLETMVV